MSNMPEAAKMGKTHLFRYIMQFHEKLLQRLGVDSVNTLRNTIWQLDEYLETNGKYADAEFMRSLIPTLEFICVKKGGDSFWTLDWAKKHLSGRVRGVNQFSKNYKPKKRPKVSIDLSQSIEKRLIEIPRREVEDPQKS